MNVANEVDKDFILRNIDCLYLMYGSPMLRADDKLYSSSRSIFVGSGNERNAKYLPFFV